MTTEKAIRHLQKKIGFNKYSSDYDKECMNQIIEYYNRTSTNELQANVLLSKLYIHVFMRFCQHYKCTPEDNTPQIQLHKLLELPLVHFLREFRDGINLIQMEADAKNGFITPEDRWNLDDMAENINAQIGKAIEAYNKQ